MMDYKKLNNLLKNLQNVDSKLLKFVERQTEYEITDEDGEQGAEGVYYNIYEIIGEKDLYLKVEFYTDSYGYNDAPRGVQFVKPVEKKITAYTEI